MLLDRKFFNKHKSGFVRYKVKCLGKIRQERNLFKSTLIHDIKTPVLALIQCSKLLLSGSLGALNDLQFEIIAQMQESNHLLLEIIKNFDFLLSCENKEYCFIFEKIELIREIKKCVCSLRNKLKEKNQKIIINTPEKLFLECDINACQKIIQNLINNSISLAKENSLIEISAKETKERIYFYVKNKSLFMSEEKINSMFEKERSSLCDFNQLGMGFTLNMTKRLISLQNWRLIARVKKENVSVFGFIAPK